MRRDALQHLQELSVGRCLLKLWLLLGRSALQVKILTSTALNFLTECSLLSSSGADSNIWQGLRLRLRKPVRLELSDALLRRALVVCLLRTDVVEVEVESLWLLVGE